MKFDVGQSVARVQAGTIGAPQVVIGYLCSALGIGHIDMTDTSQNIFANSYNNHVDREAG